MTTAREAEFTAYVTQRRNDLLRTAVMLTAGDRALAEDLVQTVLIKLYARWPTIADSPGGGVHAYARRSLATAFVDEHRRPWRRRERSHEVVPDTAAAATGSGALGDLGPALAALPPRMRAVVVLRFLHDMNVSDTAATLGCTEGTVKSQTARALDHLRRNLAATPDPLSTRSS